MPPKIMTEYKVGKDRTMQTYNHGTTATVSFYNGHRHDGTLVPFFSDYAESTWGWDMFYIRVPWEKINEYLETVGK